MDSIERESSLGNRSVWTPWAQTEFSGCLSFHSPPRMPTKYEAETPMYCLKGHSLFNSIWSEKITLKLLKSSFCL